MSLTWQFTLWFLAMSAIYIAPTLPKPFATLMGMAFLLIGVVVLLIGRMT